MGYKEQLGDKNAGQLNQLKRKVIEDFLHHNAQNLYKDYSTKDCFPLQQEMYYYKMTQPLDAIVIVSKDEVKEFSQISKIINRMISNNEVFRWYLSIEDEKLKINTIHDKIELQFPTVYFDEINLGIEEVFTEAIDSLMSSLFRSQVLNYLLYQVYILENQKYFKIVFSISHIIADGGINKAINKAFRNELMGRTKVESSYSAYMEEVITASRNDSIIDRYIEELNSINKKNNFKFENQNKNYDKWTFIEVDAKNENSWVELILKVAYEIGTIGCKKMGLDEIVVKVSLNFRDIFGSKYESLVGACQSFFFCIVKVESIDSFKERNFANIQKYLFKGHLDFNYLCSQGFTINNSKRESNRYIDLNNSTLLNVNLLSGNISKKENVILFLNSLAETNSHYKEAVPRVLRLEGYLWNKKIIIYLPDTLSL